jgi:hypothetical protein
MRARTEIPVGTRFGTLKFVKELDMVRNGNVVRRMALLECNCGKIVNIQLNSLFNGVRKSCGKPSCLNKYRDYQLRKQEELERKKSISNIEKKTELMLKLNKIQELENEAIFLAERHSETSDSFVSEMLIKTRQLINENTQS